MATNNAPGFLSKVARFVRNPLTNWADLDHAEADKDNSYSKAALREMIERKRRNDFVRKREFDQLRKLRSRGLLGFDPADRPSFFHSSLPSNPVERAVTLKKIDEIEAQMSQQWWKSKPAGNSAPGASIVGQSIHSSPSRQATAGSPARPGAAASSNFARTTSSGLGARASTGSQALQSGAGRGAVSLQLETDRRNADRATEPMPLPMDRAGALEPLPRASGWLDVTALDAAEQEGFVHDPDLEEAAIRFANGDYKGAEAALLAQITPGGVGVDRAQTWLTLFDLYRATGEHDRFDNIAVEFASRFGRSAPVWAAMASAQSQTGAAGPSSVAGALPVLSRGFTWTAPDLLTTKSLGALEAALTKAPEPWRLNWSRLASIDDQAYEALLRLMNQWNGQPRQLRFVAPARLEQRLLEATPTGEREVDPLRWRLRMELLRLTGRVDDFDLAALEYCITYEVSPPSWSEAMCGYMEVSPDGEPLSPLTGGSADTSDFGADSRPGSFMTAPQTLPLPIHPWEKVAELSGQLVGDATEVLAKLEQSVQGGRSLGVRCEQLARVDFSAAGSVLNWAAARHADGCQVEFSNVQRLVAVFFNVIGINEYARVTARQN